MGLAIDALIKQIANAWPGYYAQRVADKNHPAFKLIYHDLPDCLAAANKGYKHLTVDSSGGAGNITRAPWAASFDKRITDAPTKGYYVVYLFSVDMQKVVLELGLGTTQFTKFYGENKDALAKIRTAAQTMQMASRDIFHAECTPEFIGRISTDPVDLRTGPKDKLQRGYEQSSIYSLS